METTELANQIDEKRPQQTPERAEFLSLWKIPNWSIRSMRNPPTYLQNEQTKPPAPNQPPETPLTNSKNAPNQPPERADQTTERAEFCRHENEGNDCESLNVEERKSSDTSD